MKKQDWENIADYITKLENVLNGKFQWGDIDSILACQTKAMNSEYMHIKDRDTGGNTV